MLDVVQERESGGVDVKLVRCPVCFVDLRGKKPSCHIEKHQPEDFGLTPLGDARAEPGRSATAAAIEAPAVDLVEVPSP